jgi:hypothetical protein
VATIPNTNGIRQVLVAGSSQTAIDVTVNDNQLLVDADIFLGVGQPPMLIRQNQISGRPSGWDKQSTSNALEIVNQKLLPVLQIIYLENALVVIKGVFANGDTVTIADENSMVLAAKSEDVKSFPIKRLFKYPSWKYPGVLEE